LTIYQRGETYVNRVTVKDRNNNRVDPATIVETVQDPCGFPVLSSASMQKDSDGEYYYNYDISSSATYGRYPVTVTTTTAGGSTAIIKDEFFVLSWDADRDVRQLTGIGDEKTISGTDLENIIWMSYQEALRDVHFHNYGEKPKGNPNTGAGVDGANTIFQTRAIPIADINGKQKKTKMEQATVKKFKKWTSNMPKKSVQYYFSKTGYYCVTDSGENFIELACRKDGIPIKNGEENE